MFFFPSTGEQNVTQLMHMSPVWPSFFRQGFKKKKRQRREREKRGSGWTDICLVEVKGRCKKQPAATRRPLESYGALALSPKHLTSWQQPPPPFESRTPATVDKDKPNRSANRRDSPLTRMCAQVSPCVHMWVCGARKQYRRRREKKRHLFTSSPARPAVPGIRRG